MSVFPLTGNEVVLCNPPQNTVTTGQIAALASTTASALPVSDKNGIMMPFFFYPNNPYTDATCQALLALFRQFHDVPVILVFNIGNPGGPGNVWDGNWAAAITLFRGAGCYICGYADTAFGARSPAAVQADIANWNAIYSATPVQGIFLDEMAFDASYIPLYQSYYAFAKAAGYGFVIGNPGTNEGGTYYAANPPTADLINIHENSNWISAATAEGNFVGGHSNYLWSKNAVLVYDQPTFDTNLFNSIKNYAKYFYITDANLPNPYGAVSSYLSQTMAACSSSGSNYFYNVPTTGFTLTITAPYTILDPAGTLATGTIKFPATPQDGDRLSVSSSHAITGLTLNGNGQTISNAATTLAAGGTLHYIYNAALTTWYVI